MVAHKLELFLCRLLSLSYSDKEYPLKIDYLEIRRKIKGIILYSVHEKLSDNAQLPFQSFAGDQQ